MHRNHKVIEKHIDFFSNCLNSKGSQFRNKLRVRSGQNIETKLQVYVNTQFLENLPKTRGKSYFFRDKQDKKASNAPIIFTSNSFNKQTI